MDEIFDHVAGLKDQREKKTFYRDDLLPSLPLPSIHETIEKYLDSCKALLTDEEYKHTEEICTKFKTDEALGTQLSLVRKAIRERNWLAEWWNDHAYLRLRLPIMYYYFAGPSPYLHTIWPFQEGSQLERSAIVLYNVMQFWLAMKTEIFPQHKAGDDAYMSMHQFRYMFNTSRIPKRDKDEIHNSFKTSTEGDSPTHIIIFFRNRMYKIQGLNQKTGKILTPPEFLKILKNIVDNSREDYGESVAALTCLDRDSWADTREYMINVSDKNKKNLKDIEDALICFCLDESRPKSYADLYHLGLAGPCANKWNDKSFNYTCTVNGGLVASCDHSPYEAMVMIVFVQYAVKLMDLAEKEYKKPWRTDVEIEPIEELVFYLDDTIRDSIRKALTEYNKFSSNLEVAMKKFDAFGKTALKKFKTHPDAFAQTCIQLAYMRMHGHPAPAYETATTRRFYMGRTETCRTCTPELVAFCRAFINGSPDSFSLFRKSHDKFVQLMNECKEGRGCDRHLMGFALETKESGEELPALFSDPAFAKTGGNGNFVLSTSFLGYFDGVGGVAPMVEDGYGIFYCINNDRAFFTSSAWKSSSITSAKKFMEQLQLSFIDVFDMINKNFPSKL